MEKLKFPICDVDIGESYSGGAANFVLEAKADIPREATEGDIKFCRRLVYLGSLCIPVLYPIGDRRGDCVKFLLELILVFLL